MYGEPRIEQRAPDAHRTRRPMPAIGTPDPSDFHSSTPTASQLFVESRKIKVMEIPSCQVDIPKHLYPLPYTDNNHEDFCHSFYFPYY